MPDVVIDTKKLPASMLLDTTVVLRGFGAYSDDERTPACISLVEACLRHGTTLLIAAPTVAEILRGGATRSIPRVSHIEVVAFDHEAANVLGRSFQAEYLHTFATEIGLRLSYVKYDALIIACALRYNAGCFVCLDAQQLRLATQAGQRAATPADFVAAQQPLF